MMELFYNSKLQKLFMRHTWFNYFYISWFYSEGYMIDNLQAKDFSVMQKQQILQDICKINLSKFCEINGLEKQEMV